MNVYWLSRMFGWLVVAASAPLGYALLRWLPCLGIEAVAFVMLMQLSSGCALVYAAGEIMRGTDLGHKAFPATWVFFLFFAVMTWRLVTDAQAAI